MQCKRYFKYWLLFKSLDLPFVNLEGLCDWVLYNLPGVGGIHLLFRR